MHALVRFAHIAAGNIFTPPKSTPPSSKRSAAPRMLHPRFAPPRPLEQRPQRTRGSAFWQSLHTRWGIAGTRHCSERIDMRVVPMRGNAKFCSDACRSAGFAAGRLARHSRPESCRRARVVGSGGIFG
jgi:hypothetical protein